MASGYQGYLPLHAKYLMVCLMLVFYQRRVEDSSACLQVRPQGRPAVEFLSIAASSYFFRLLDIAVSNDEVRAAFGLQIYLRDVLPYNA